MSSGIAAPVRGPDGRFHKRSAAKDPKDTPVKVADLVAPAETTASAPDSPTDAPSPRQDGSQDAATPQAVQEDSAPGSPPERVLSAAELTARGVAQIAALDGQLAALDREMAATLALADGLSATVVACDGHVSLLRQRADQLATQAADASAAALLASDANEEAQAQALAASLNGQIADVAERIGEATAALADARQREASEGPALRSQHAELQQRRAAIERTRAAVVRRVAQTHAAAGRDRLEELRMEHTQTLAKRRAARDAYRAADVALFTFADTARQALRDGGWPDLAELPIEQLLPDRTTPTGAVGQALIDMLATLEQYMGAPLPVMGNGTDAVGLPLVLESLNRDSLRALLLGDHFSAARLHQLRRDIRRAVERVGDRLDER